MNRHRIPDEVNRDLFTDPTPGPELIQRCFSSPAGKTAYGFGCSALYAVLHRTKASL